MTEPADRDLLVPAALVHRIADGLDGAVEDGRVEAERIRSAPRSDGYTREDIEYAQAWVEEATKTRDAFKELRDKPAAPCLPPIAYADEATESWIGHLDAAQGWTVELTFLDGSTRDAVVRGAGFYGPQYLAGVTVAFFEGDKEPEDDALEVVVYSTDVARIRVY